MRPAALLWGAFVLHRRFPFVKASPLGRGVTEGDGEGKDSAIPGLPSQALTRQLSQRESLLAERRQQTAYKGYTFLSIIIERVFPHEP